MPIIRIEMWEGEDGASDAGTARIRPSDAAGCGGWSLHQGWLMETFECLSSV